MKSTTKLKVLRSSFTFVFAFLICLTVFTSQKNNANILYSSQDLFVLLASCILGLANGAGSTGLFFIAGCAGLKVFPGFYSGFSSMYNEYAGFLWSYFIGSFVCGLIIGLPSVYEKKITAKFIVKILISLFLFYIIYFLLGSFWFCYCNGLSFFRDFGELSQTLYKPFIFSVLMKIVCSFIVTLFTRPLVAKLLYPPELLEEEKNEIINKLKYKKVK